MGRKEKSNLIRIEKATRARRQKYTTTLQEISRQSTPGELITTVREYPPVVPTGSEYELLQDVLSSTDNVYYNPHRRREDRIDRSQLKYWQVLGFEYYANFQARLA
ncbi:hypothetical protein QFI91_05055 [Raoultella sp. WB_B2P2-3]|uniref:hypothetical protein n=1 Tax=Raoultella scottii TaxID=3040937 RepID=UPI002F94617B